MTTDPTRAALEPMTQAGRDLWGLLMPLATSDNFSHNPLEDILAIEQEAAALAHPNPPEGERVFDWNKVGPELEALGQAIADTIDPANPMQSNESTMDCIEHLWASGFRIVRVADPTPPAPEPSAALVEADDALRTLLTLSALLVSVIDSGEVLSDHDRATIRAARGKARAARRSLAAARAEGVDVGALAKALQVLVDEDSGGWHDWLAGEGTMGPAIEGLRVARKVAAAYQAALAARSAGSGSRVEREDCRCICHRDGGGECISCSVGKHTLDAMRGLPRPTPPPAVDGTRCAECGGVKDDVFHVPCLVGGPFHYVKTCHPFTPPTPDPDRLRALEAALRDLADYTEGLAGPAAVHSTRYLITARALLADGERSDG